MLRAMRWDGLLLPLLLLVACQQVEARYDLDGDGDEDSHDCAPEDPAVHRGAVEIPDDGIDNDCSGGDLLCDADDDGVFNDHELCGGTDCSDVDASCADPIDCVDADDDGTWLCHGDCDDTDPAQAPGLEEICDGVDNDCVGGVPEAEQDLDGDGESPCDGDCDDDDPSRWSAAPETCNGADDDCDSVVPTDEIDEDGDGFLACEDCNDGAATSYPNATEVPYDGIDQDCDGADLTDVDGDGYVAELAGGDDCDDEDPAEHPDAPDFPLDGQIPDCDGFDGIDGDGDGAPLYTGGGDGWLGFGLDCDDDDPALDRTDADGDGQDTCEGDCDDSDPEVHGLDLDGDGVTTCGADGLPATDDEDCDDDDPAVLPGAPEICDGKDSDCDPATSLPQGEDDLDGDGDRTCSGCADGDPACGDCDDSDPALTTLDGDLDGWSSCDGDCDDVQASFNPTTTDVVGDGFDQNCDGIDGIDVDQDLWASVASGGSDCDDLDAWWNLDDVDGDGASTCASDCDDADPTLNPLDVDGDWWTTCEGDCDDADPDLHPAALEVCDGIDNDCDPTTDEATDEDADGQSECDGDCDDSDPLAFAGNPEACDLVDNDCDGEVDEGTDDDSDGDGWYECQGDCDDAEDDHFPGAPELCDGQDNDCDGIVPTWDVDDDGDGYRPCDGDCDDAEAWSNPGATELIDGLDNDCDAQVDLGAVTCTSTVPIDHSSIQGAVDASSDGDVVCVEPGTWIGHVSLGNRSIQLLGLAGPGLTVLDGAGASRVLTILSGWLGSTPLVKGFTVTGGYVESYTNGGGAGVLVDNSKPLLQDLWVTGNTACSKGGGLFITGGTAPFARLERVRVTNNVATSPCHVDVNGGGLYIDGSWGVIATDLVVANNSAVGSYSQGGGIAAHAPLTCHRCLVVDNHADSEADGILVADPLTLTSSLVVANGEVGIKSWDDLDLSNTVVADHGSDGVLLWGGTTATFSNVVFTGNAAAVDCYGGTQHHLDSVFLSNTTAIGTRVATPPVLDIQSTVFYENSVLVQHQPSPIGVDGNLAADPQFADTSHPDPRWWDLHLATSSDLVDVGADFDPDGSPSDIGVFGGPGADQWDRDADGYPSWWQPGAYDFSNYPTVGWDCDDLDASVYPGNGC
jgi:hypothetical protein